MTCKDVNWWLLLMLLAVGVAFSLFLVYWKKSEVSVGGGCRAGVFDLQCSKLQSTRGFLRLSTPQSHSGGHSALHTHAHVHALPRSLRGCQCKLHTLDAPCALPL